MAHMATCEETDEDRFHAHVRSIHENFAVFEILDILTKMLDLVRGARPRMQDVDSDATRLDEMDTSS
jgi:hypothetical protein